MDLTSLVLSIIAVCLALYAIVRTIHQEITPEELLPPTQRPAIPDEMTEMELCGPDGKLDGRRVVSGPPPVRFVRPHGKSKKVVYQRAERIGDHAWRYIRD